MPRSRTTNDEVQILRFFEEEPIEKAQVVFNIVREKMRARAGTNAGPERRVVRKKGQEPAASLPEGAGL